MAAKAKSQLKGNLSRLYDKANPVSGKRQEEGYSLPRELKKGDTVRVSYTGWIEGEDTSEAVYASVSRAYA